MRISTRKAEIKDINRIIELLSVIANEHHEGRPDIFKKDSIKYTARELREILRQREKRIFVAADDNDYVLGYVFCQINIHENQSLFRNFKTLYIDDICIDSSVRGMGIGKKLFQCCREYAESSGCHNIELNVWSFNLRAVEFYKSLNMETQCFKMELKL